MITYANYFFLANLDNDKFSSLYYNSHNYVLGAMQSHNDETNQLQPLVVRPPTDHNISKRRHSTITWRRAQPDDGQHNQLTMTRRVDWRLEFWTTRRARPHGCVWIHNHGYSTSGRWIHDVVGMFSLYMYTSWWLPTTILIILFKYQFIANLDDDKSPQSIRRVDGQHNVLTDNTASRWSKQQCI